MNIKQLENELDNLGIPKNYYSFNGHLLTDTYILNQVYSKWEYFYYDEKGNQEGYKSFDNEDEACRYFLKKLKNEIKYPPSSFK
ncbi:MAG: hypothetical protein QME45_14030 [Clostridiales bacterium]|nr:hypothetical protein [Clostridiales bacterium]